MKDIRIHCLVLLLSIFGFTYTLLGQGENSESEYTFILQEMENGHTNISWEGANNDAILGYIFSLYNDLGGLEERLQIIEPNVSVVLGENYSWDVEDVDASSIDGFTEDMPEVIVTGDEIDFPIRDALTWYQGEFDIEEGELENAIYDEMDLEVELIFDDDEYISIDDFTGLDLENWDSSYWQNQPLTIYNLGDLLTVNSIKWDNRTIDTLALELDYRVRYSADGVEEKVTNTASLSLIYVYDYTNKKGADIEGDSGSLEIYPTIFRDDLNWAYMLSDDDVLSFDIFNANGRKVYTYQARDVIRGTYEQNLSTANWGAGNYYCVISCNGKIENRQLIKLP